MEKTIFHPVNNIRICAYVLGMLISSLQNLSSQILYKIDQVGVKFDANSGIVTDFNHIWIATNVGLYNPIEKRFALKNIPVRFIVSDINNFIWAVTLGDTIRCLSMDGRVIGTPSHFLNSLNIGDILSDNRTSNAFITSISTYKDFVFIGTDSNFTIRYSCYDAGTPNPIIGTIIQTNIAVALSVFAQKPQLNGDYSIVVCGSDGLYTGKTDKEDDWKLSRVSKNNTNLPDIPVKVLPSTKSDSHLEKMQQEEQSKDVKVLPSTKSDSHSNLYFWLIGWNGYSSIAGKLVVSTEKNKTLFLQSDCLEKTTYQPYDFALTKDENLWIATANGLVYYTLNATCDSLLTPLTSNIDENLTNEPEHSHPINEDNLETDKYCQVQGLLRVNQATFPGFPLRTVHHVAVQNDSVIWFAANTGYVYRLTITTDTSKAKKSPDLIVKKKAFYFNFLPYLAKEKDQHLQFPDYDVEKKTTSKDLYKKYKAEIKKMLANNPALQLHLIAFASEPSEESDKTPEAIATERAKKMEKYFSVPKRQIKTHVLGYVPKEKGGPANPDVVKVVLSCTCDEFEIKEDVE